MYVRRVQECQENDVLKKMLNKAETDRELTYQRQLSLYKAKEC